MDIDELKRKFADYSKEMEVNLQGADSAMCKDLYNYMHSQDDESISHIVEQLVDAQAFDEKISREYVSLYILLAKKLFDFGDLNLAQELLDEGSGYLVGNSALESKIKELKQSIEDAAKPKEEPQVKAPISTQEVIKDNATAKKKPNLLLIGGAVAVVLAGFFFFSRPSTPASTPTTSNKVEQQKEQTVSVSADVPAGTEVIIDGNKVDITGEVKLKVGEHKLVLKHPLLDFTYDQKLVVSNAGKIALYKEMKAGQNLVAAAQKANIDMMNDVLAQACKGEQFNINPSLYTADADKNGKLSKAQQAMHKFTAQKAIKSISVEQASVANVELLNAEKKVIVKCPVELMGKADNGLNFNYSINTTLEIKGDNLVVNSLDSFKAQVVK